MASNRDMFNLMGALSEKGKFAMSFSIRNLQDTAPP